MGWFNRRRPKETRHQAPSHSEHPRRAEHQQLALQVQQLEARISAALDLIGLLPAIRPEELGKVAAAALVKSLRPAQADPAPAEWPRHEHLSACRPLASMFSCKVRTVELGVCDIMVEDLPDGKYRLAMQSGANSMAGTIDASAVAFLFDLPVVTHAGGITPIVRFDLEAA